MKKVYLYICALNCLLLACSSEENSVSADDSNTPGENQLGEECPENVDANYADDEYSTMKNEQALLWKIPHMPAHHGREQCRQILLRSL